MNNKRKGIEDLLADVSFVRWINEESGSSEAELWEEWLRRDPVNASTYRQAIELYRSLRFSEEHADTMHELSKLETSVSNYEINRILKRRRSAYPAVFTIAALILLAVLFIYESNRVAGPADTMPEKEIAQVITTYGQIQKVTFPDGSAVTLNANSTLTYSEPFLTDEVEFYIEGEAYFSIEPSEDKHGTKRKYSVHTADGVVSILGTSFNVNTWNNRTTVVLDRGEVGLAKESETGRSNEQRYLMEPGELASFSASEDQIEVQKVRTDLYTSWTDLKWIFEDTPLTEIAERIEATYGLEVIIHDERAAGMRFSGTAPNQSLPVLLEGLKVLLEIPVEAGPESITIGT